MTLTGAEREALGWVVFDGAPSRDELLASVEAAVERIVADRLRAVEAERDAYRKAKQENDERFQIAAQDARAERDEWKAKYAELEGAISWGTTCLNCANMLDKSYAEYVRADQAEADLAVARRSRDALQKVAAYNTDRADKAEADLAAERAKHEALRAGLAEALGWFVHSTHPGQPCKQSGHIPVEMLDRLAALLDAEAGDGDE